MASNYQMFFQQFRQTVFSQTMESYIVLDGAFFHVVSIDGTVTSNGQTSLYDAMAAQRELEYNLHETREQSDIVTSHRITIPAVRG